MAKLNLSNISVAALQAEVNRRMNDLKKYIAQRTELDRKIAELKSLQTPASAAAPDSLRATGKPLAEYVKEAVDSAAKGIKEIEQYVIDAGYPTKAKTLYNQIVNVLSKGNFKKVQKGIYALATGKDKGKTSASAKPAAVKSAAKSAGKGKKKKYSQTAEQFVLGLVSGKGSTTAEITKAWKAAGRGGKADNTLMKLVKAKKVKREKQKRGSLYTTA